MIGTRALEAEFFNLTLGTSNTNRVTFFWIGKDIEVLAYRSGTFNTNHLKIMWHNIRSQDLLDLILDFLVEIKVMTKRMDM